MRGGGEGGCSMMGEMLEMEGRTDRLESEMGAGVNGYVPTTQVSMSEWMEG